MAWDMLWAATASGGTLIYTFDYPDVSVEWLEQKTGERCVEVVDPIKGKRGSPQVIYLELFKDE
jgi:frataxin-like iron-binding protein CyaY